MEYTPVAIEAIIKKFIICMAKKHKKKRRPSLSPMGLPSGCPLHHRHQDIHGPLQRNGLDDSGFFVTAPQEMRKDQKKGKELTPSEIPGIQLLFFRI